MFREIEIAQKINLNSGEPQLLQVRFNYEMTELLDDQDVPLVSSRTQSVSSRAIGFFEYSIAIGFFSGIENFNFTFNLKFDANPAKLRLARPIWPG
jgi:hypothetical protein